MRKLWIGLLLIFAGALFVGYRLNREWTAHPAPLARTPLQEDIFQNPPLEPELEAFIPDGAVALIGVRGLKGLLGRFSSTNLYIHYEQSISSAVRKAEETYGAKNLSKRYLSDTSSIETIIGESMVVAFYPKPSKIIPAAYTGLPGTQDPMPGSAYKPDPILLISKTQPQAEKQIEEWVKPYAALLSRQGYGRNFIQSLNKYVFWAFLTKGKSRWIFVGNTLDTVKKALDLATAQSDKKPLSEGEWVKKSFKKLPKDAFGYVLLNLNGIPGARNKMSYFPIVPDWYCQSLTWKDGVEVHGFLNSNPELENSAFGPLTKIGPSDYPILRLIPDPTLAVTATNSLTPEAAENILDDLLLRGALLPKKLSESIGKWKKDIAGQACEQAYAAYNGFQKSGSEYLPDVFGAVQIASQLKVQAALEIARKLLDSKDSDASLEKKLLEGYGSYFTLTYKDPAGRGKKIFMAQNGNYLLFASNENRIKSLLIKGTHSSQSIYAIAANLPAQGNATIFYDIRGLYENWIQVGIEEAALKTGNPWLMKYRESLMAWLEFFSGFKGGTTILSNTQKGLSIRSFYPYQDYTYEQWEQKLFNFKPRMREWTLAGIQSRILYDTYMIQYTVNSAIQNYKKRAHKNPPTLRSLVPKYLSAIPENPLSETQTVHSTLDGKGGWYYNPITGTAVLNFSNVKLFPGYLAPAGNAASEKNEDSGKYDVKAFSYPSYMDKEETTRKNLLSLRDALLLFSDDHNGDVPEKIKDLVPKYIKSIPIASLENHPNSNKISSTLDDKGGWYYLPNKAMIKINCTHSDHEGSPYYNW